MIGSASIIVRDEHRNGQKNTLFTGDMGKPYQSLCGGYKDLIPRFPEDPINVMMVESTCFEGEPVTFEERKLQLFNAIYGTWQNNGVPLITTLSFHREQEIVEMLHNFQKSGKIPNDCRIIIDAPLATKLTNVFKSLKAEQLTDNFGDVVGFYKSEKSSLERFDLKNVEIVESHKASKDLSREMSYYHGKAIIIASGGMGTRGRSVNYLHGLFNENPNNSIIFTCYQVPGTPGAELKDQPSDLTKAKKIFLNGNTSHISGPEQTFDYLERYNLADLGTVIVGHGCDSARKAMSLEFQIRGYEYTKVFTPKLGQPVMI